MEQSRLGQILLDFQLIQESQLEEAVQSQEAGHAAPLGEILVEMGHLDDRSLRSILGVQQRKIEIDQASRGVDITDLKQRLRRVEDVHTLIGVARELGASDLMLSSDRQPTVRVHGALVDLPCEAIGADDCRRLIFGLLSDEQQREYYEARTLTHCTETPDGLRVRVATYRHLGGIAAVIRLLPAEVTPFSELGLPLGARKLVDFPHGLVLITGPAGAGKSTTLNSLLDHLNREQRRHIVTIEKPIEVFHRSELSMVSQIEVGRNTVSFEDGLRSALRQDPDVLVVGHLKDPEMTATALTAAETGHLVFATMHTQNAFRTILRVMDQFQADKREHVRTMLASSLRAILCQQLIPSSDGDQCHVAAEMVFVNDAISNLIKEDRIWQIPMVVQTHKEQGMLSMDDSLNQLYQRGSISLEEAARSRHGA